MVNIGGTNTGNERRGLSFLVFVGIIGFSVARAIATFLQIIYGSILLI